ncbi:FAD-binding oxidoreductase [Streptomyces sp. NPDC048272]|uniref:FAD-binding oxidoreductase n=1 Tax=Streptomyces sp. NPDC048272 TaxID=3154616 RepID=UPI00342B46AA
MKRRTFLGAGAVTTAGLLMPPAVSYAASEAAPWAALQRSIDGAVVLPDDPRYDTVRALALRQFDAIRPQAVVRCESAGDVAEAVRFAVRHRIPAVARSGGHSFAGYSTTTGMVIDVSPMDHLRMVDEVARMGPGCQLIDVEEGLAPRGVAVPTGWCPTVAIGGLALGGGLGFLTRMHGVASDRMLRAQVVLADGRVVESDERRHPDLFWALRGGGGGNFGIVTEYDFAPVRAPDMTSFTLTWPWSAARAVIGAWQRWTAATPDALTPLLNLSTYGDDPAVEPGVTVSGVWLRSPDGLGPLLARLTAMAGASPATSQQRTDSYGMGMRHWFGCDDLDPAGCHRIGHNPQAKLARYGFALARGNFYDAPLDEAGIDAALAAFADARKAGEYRSLDLQGLGGAHNRVSPTATAYVHRSALFYGGWSVGIDVPEGEVLESARRRACQEWVDRAYGRVHPWSSGQSYQNYIDPDLADWRQAYYGVNYRRLVAVKEAYDPRGFFRFAQSIG